MGSLLSFYLVQRMPTLTYKQSHEPEQAHSTNTFHLYLGQGALQLPDLFVAFVNTGASTEPQGPVPEP